MMNFGLIPMVSWKHPQVPLFSSHMKNYFDNICISCAISLCPSRRCEYLFSHRVEFPTSVTLNRDHSFHVNICTTSKLRDQCCIVT